ncbi:hypothetical protein LTR08_002282 [Meristemomyces frigidus]|nr:hypothetical protein LTR08_002282 [Meristemomyces frigidus]
MLATEDISLIRTACPNLAHLGLDIDRSADHGWPNETFVALAQLTKLTSLEFGLEIGADLGHEHGFVPVDWDSEGLNGPGPFREPRMSLNVSEALFADLRRNKQGQPLKDVTFGVGDDPAKYYAGPLHMFPLWGEGRARRPEELRLLWTSLEQPLIWE